MSARSLLAVCLLGTVLVMLTVHDVSATKLACGRVLDGDRNPATVSPRWSGFASADVHANTHYEWTVVQADHPIVRQFRDKRCLFSNDDPSDHSLFKWTAAGHGADSDSQVPTPKGDMHLLVRARHDNEQVVAISERLETRASDPMLPSSLCGAEKGICQDRWNRINGILLGNAYGKGGAFAPPPSTGRNSKADPNSGFTFGVSGRSASGQLFGFPPEPSQEDSDAAAAAAFLAAAQAFEEASNAARNNGFFNPGEEFEDIIAGENDDDLDGGQIAGIVLGCVIFVLLIILLIVILVLVFRDRDGGGGGRSGGQSYHGSADPEEQFYTQGRGNVTAANVDDRTRVEFPDTALSLDQQVDAPDAGGADSGRANARPDMSGALGSNSSSLRDYRSV